VKDMNRILHLIIKSCQECPYRVYNRSFDMDYDPYHIYGHNCDHREAPDNDRIVDDSDLTQKKKRDGWPPIPEWCPLPEGDK
jgi:hypothetical protein